MKAKFAGTFLPDQLDRKYKNAAKEFIWQWLFPAQSLTLLPEAQEYRRYHIHESVVQKAIKKAVNDAKTLNGLRRIPSDIPLPVIYCRRTMIFARFRNCWGTAIKNDNDLYPYGAKRHN